MCENSDELIQTVTRIALSTPCEELRFKILTVLEGCRLADRLGDSALRIQQSLPHFRLPSVMVAGLRCPRSYNFQLWDRIYEILP